MKFRSLVLDVDSTLCGIEGVDWLAERRGADVARRTRELTERAMNGDVPLENVYGERLAVIRPTRDDIEALAGAYRSTIAPGARETIAHLRSAGVRVVLVSGGLRQAIQPLAGELGVELLAVDVYFDDAGGYAGFDERSPLARQTGKYEAVAALGIPRPALAVGDGATDVHLRRAVDSFAAYTGFVRRESVVAQADAVLESFTAIERAILG